MSSAILTKDKDPCVQTYVQEPLAQKTHNISGGEGFYNLLRVLSKIETDSNFWIAVSEDKRGGLFRRMSSIIAAKKCLILQNKCLITTILLKSYK